MNSTPLIIAADSAGSSSSRREYDSINPSPVSLSSMPIMAPINSNNSSLSPPSIEMQDSPTSASGTILSSTINLLNTILGSGMLAMPNAIATVGLIPGLFCIVLSALASRLGLLLLARAATQAPPRQASFNAISKLTYPNAALLFDLAVAVKCFGVAVSYLIVIADLLPPVVRELLPAGSPADHFLLSRQFWLLASMALVVPLSLLKRLDSLKYTSFVALTSVVYLIVLVIYAYADNQWPALPADKTPLIRPTWRFWKKLTVFVFAFTCHQNVFSIHNELADNRLVRVQSIVNGSVAISCVIYLVIGSLGYLMFGLDSGPNLLTSLVVKQRGLLTVAQLSFALLVVFSYPLQCHPSRASFEKLLIATKKSLIWHRLFPYLPASMTTAKYTSLRNEEDAGNEGDQFTAVPPSGETIVDPESAEKAGSAIDDECFDESLSSGNMQPASPAANGNTMMCNSRHFTLTAAILACSYLIAFFVHDLSLVLSFVGATGSVTICYILPSLFYLRLTAPLRRWTAYRLGAAALLCAGCLLMPICVIFIFI